MNKLFIYIAFFLFSAVIFTVLISRSFRPGQIPNGFENSCENCHISSAGGGERNNFGKLVEARFLTSQDADGNVIWNPLLASLDADNDGVTNGEELQDPFGEWSVGKDNPGNSSLVTLPGDINDKSTFNLRVQFSGMSPHVGQLLELRVLDRITGKEIVRRTVPSIASADFNLDMEGLLSGHSYYIDFYADLNGNGLYDDPPVDHTWRLELNDVEGDETVQFGHNTNFSQLNWNYLLKLNLVSMGPHVGQQFEARVIDLESGMEVGRGRMEFMPNDFSLNIPGLKSSGQYEVEFYADHNNNGIYDDPPADHTWTEVFTNNEGDYELDFTHNTNFSALDWKYEYKLNLLSMTPHIGQLIELRVVDPSNSEEVGRTSIAEVPAEDFTLSIPGIETGKDYNVDFYADLNANGSYDAPPTDHAWRMTFNSSTGNFVQNFSHNTNFTDIQWTEVVGVEDGLSIPLEYSLKQNYPNPFNPQTRIDFSLKDNAFVTLRIFNILGEEKSVLINQNLAAGNHSVLWNAEGFESGVYLYRIEAENFSETRKMILLK